MENAAMKWLDSIFGENGSFLAWSVEVKEVEEEEKPAKQL